MRARNSQTLSYLKEAVNHFSPDVITISGDIYDNRVINPYEELGTLGKPVIFCLGNHEFIYRTVEETLNQYRQYERHKDVYCLDVDGHVDIDGVRFVGNVLWYDGTCSIRDDCDYHLRYIDDGWLDREIVDFKPVDENHKCVNQIINNCRGFGGKKVLLTHTVPHWELNWFCYHQPLSVYNIYSGVQNLFLRTNLYFNACICGHTHKAMDIECPCSDGRKIYCYNIGNDYFERSNGLTKKLIVV